jgi:hypothetical protein
VVPVYEARPLLVPLLVNFVVAVKERQLRRLHDKPPPPELPKATLLD